MMVKSGLEKIFLKFLKAEAIFFELILLHRKEAFATNYKFSYKNDVISAWRDFKKNLCVVCRYDKWNFNPKILPIPITF